MKEVSESNEVNKTDKPKGKKNKLLIIIISCVAVILLVVGGIVFYKKYQEEKKNRETYEHGLQLIEKKEWERATTLFEGLGDYKDSKEKLIEIVLLENSDKIDNGLKYPSLYEKDLQNGVRALLQIQDKSEAKNKLDYVLNEAKNKIEKERNVANSVNKDYSLDVFKYLGVLSIYSYDKTYGADAKKYICDFATQAFKEGFATYSITSEIKYNCEDTSFLTNSKYYTLVDNSWSGEKSSGPYASYSYFLQFGVNDVMLYKETYISIYGMVPLTYSYWYKIYDNAIYVKENKNHKYKKKYTIEKLTDKALKFKGQKFTYKKM